MACIHGIGSSVVDYLIFDIPLYNKLLDFNIFNDHEPEYDHRTLIITLNISMHRDPKEENYHFQKHLIFDKNKANIFIDDLKNELVALYSMDNIENLCHNFSKTLSSSINKFSIEFLNKTSNSRTNPWYDQECKYARKEIKQATTYSVKMDKINHYKVLIKRKKGII